ncbi:hypothetical protein [Bacteroides heparinolyticus]|uniref:hypothetical protein n=1 Tax=Prevotella heparinolytica TaxID=28113 RepID=UPI003FA143DD
MQKKVSITLNRISFQKKIDIDSLQKILVENPYNEVNGIGFSKAEVFENVLESILIKRTPTSLQEFDPQIGEFVQRNIFIFDEIPFYIDLENGFIYSFSSASKLNKVKSELKNFVSGKIVYENLALNPQRIINELAMNNFDCSISEIVVRNFIYKKGAQGKYSARILDSKIGQQIMEEYSDEIQKITVDISSDSDTDFTLTISTNNAFSIKSHEDDFFNILDNLKNQIK